MSGGDSRTGTFHQTQVSVGDTASSVKGVLIIGKPKLVREFNWVQEIKHLENRNSDNRYCAGYKVLSKGC